MVISSFRPQCSKLSIPWQCFLTSAAYLAGILRKLAGGHLCQVTTSVDLTHLKTRIFHQNTRIIFRIDTVCSPLRQWYWVKFYLTSNMATISDEFASAVDNCWMAYIVKSTGPWSLTNENRGGPIKTLIVAVRLSLYGGYEAHHYSNFAHST